MLTTLASLLTLAHEESAEQDPNLVTALLTILPILFVVLFIIFFLRIYTKKYQEVYDRSLQHMQQMEDKTDEMIALLKENRGSEGRS